MLNNTQTQAVQAIAQMSAGVLKMGQELKARLASAPKPIDTEALEKCAQAMIDSGWIDEARRPQLMAVLNNPTETLRTLAEVAVKSAEAINNARTVGGNDPRLGNGTVVGHQNGSIKQASEDEEENEGQRRFRENITRFHTQLATN